MQRKWLKIPCKFMGPALGKGHDRNITTDQRPSQHHARHPDHVWAQGLFRAFRAVGVRNWWLWIAGSRLAMPGKGALGSGVHA